MDGYAGDLDPKDAWEKLKSDPKAVLIDVRSQAEWAFVGTADLSSLGREVVLAELASFPAMQPNSNFGAGLDEHLKQAGVAQDAPLLFLCRSGARSRTAAIAMTAKGYGQCFNVSEGFEGDLGPDGHRGSVNGWKVRGLPWRQS